MSFERLVSIMRRLRDPEHGCEWDLAQDFESIAPYTIEEAYEVADAIERQDMGDLADELGDLQLQVVFHAMMAEEGGYFTLDDVMAGICDKLERRHPHIFGDAAESPGWEAIKAEERKERQGDSVLNGVALALPSLDRAVKLQKRAATLGFDWPNADGPRAKIDEELAELDAEQSWERREEELGDLLFAVTNLARKLKIDPEVALKKANVKFERRFRTIENTPGFAGMSLDEQEQLWVRQKADQAAS